MGKKGPPCSVSAQRYIAQDVGKTKQPCSRAAAFKYHSHKNENLGVSLEKVHIYLHAVPSFCSMKAVASGNLGQSNSWLPSFPAGSCKGDVLSAPCWLALWRRCRCLAVTVALKCCLFGYELLLLLNSGLCFHGENYLTVRFFFNSLMFTGIITQEYYHAIS